MSRMVSKQTCLVSNIRYKGVVETVTAGSMALAATLNASNKRYAKDTLRTQPNFVLFGLPA